MTRSQQPSKALERWAGLVVTVFAVAMAYVESASVLYLRTLYGGIDPAARGGRPVTPVPDFIAVEVGREACTIVMLAAVGWLAGRRPASRLAYFLAAFGIWDVFYYVWLRLFAGWPRGLLDWDVLFLIPLPWWGPVIAPCLVAAEMAAGGLWLASLIDARGGLRPSHLAVSLLALGVAVLLVAFMWDALGVAAGIVPPPPSDARAVPVNFPWAIYVAGDSLALAGTTQLLQRQRQSLPSTFR